MKVTVNLILFLLLTCVFHPVRAQTSVEVSKPELALRNGKVRITYDLLNSVKSDLFTIRIEVTGESGSRIGARSLEGDVGDHVEGGRNKEIIWDIQADSIFLDEEIFIQVFAQSEAPPEIEEPVLADEQVAMDEQAGDLKEQAAKDVPQEAVAEQIETDASSSNTEDKVIAGDPGTEQEPAAGSDTDPGAGEEPEPAAGSDTEPAAGSDTDPGAGAEPEPGAGSASGSSGRSLNRTGLILQSVALPGLGLSRVHPGAPHWIKGVVGYGCIAGSLYLNNLAVSSYDAYKDPPTLEDVDPLFKQAKNQDMASEILAYAAIGIWVTDLVWTIAGTGDLDSGNLSGRTKGFSIGTSFEPVTAVPLFAFRYRF